MPRALQSCGALQSLFTDAWVRPGGLLGRCHRFWRERFHPALAGANVASANGSLLHFEISARLRCLQGWPRIMARNAWFQSQALRHLDNISAFQHFGISEPPPTLFAYSYAALELFRFAKTQGWRIVLGQIDPAEFEEKIVAQKHTKHPELAGNWEAAPAKYWQKWRAECELADHIVVNSEWSRTALVKSGVRSEKLKVIPLAYEADCAMVSAFQRVGISAFSPARPLRVLFLGQIILRKGMAAVLEAIDKLRDEPIEFWFVGGIGMSIPERFRFCRNVRWFGAVPRGQAHQFYKDADVFLFPTLSDGFGLTQLEAQSWQLPIITSRYCGDVVEHNRNGWVLPEVSGHAIASVLTQCVRHRELVSQWASKSHVEHRFSRDAVGAALLDLFSCRAPATP